MKRKLSWVVAVLVALNTLLGSFMGGTARAYANASISQTLWYSPTGTNVPVNTKLEVSFKGEKVRTNGAQTYTISRNADGYIDKMDISVTQATYLDSLVLSPPANLKYGTSYEVTFPAGTLIVGATDGMESPEIKWSFTTTNQSPSELTATAFYPSHGSANVSVSENPRIVFNRNVKLNSTNGGITLRKMSNSASVPITAYVSSNQVTIDPVSNLEEGTSYYIEIPSNGIYDAQYGNYYAGISGSNRWTFTTTASDKTAPVLQSATMHSNTVIRLLYNELLNTNAFTPDSSYAVTVNGENRRISYVSISGENVYVNLETGVAVGQDVKISYTGQSIRDLSGNAAASFSNKVVTNGIDSVSPKPSEGYVSGNRVTLYFSESLKSPSTYAYQQFTVTGDGSPIGISSMSHSGRSVYLYLSRSISNGEVIRVSYAPGSYPLQDYRGWELSGFGDYFVRNYNDTVAPVFKGAEGSDRTVVLNYNEALRTSELPLKSQFSVLVNNAPVYVNAVEVVNNQVLLTLASSFTQAQSVTVSYVAGTKGIADLNGNMAGYINLQPVTYAAVAEGIRSATITGDTLSIVYNTSLRSMSYLPVNQFSVFVDKVSAGIQSASVNGNTVTLKLSSAVSAGHVVTLSYLTGAAPLIDTQGNQLKSFNNMTVQNMTAGQTGQSVPSSGTQPDYLTTMSNVDFGVGGFLLNVNTAQASDSRSRFGQGIKKYTIDTIKLQTAFKYLADNNIPSKRVVFEVPSTEKAAEVAVPITALMEMYGKGKTGTFAVKFNSVMYELPIEKIPYLEISRALNVSALTSAYLTIQLEPVTKVQMPTLNYNNGVTTAPLIDPIQVYVSAYNGSASQTAVDVSHTGQIYIKASNTTASIHTSLVQYNLITRTASFVPSTVKGSGSVILFSGKVNGNAAIGPAAGYSYFTDTMKHWANKDITELASKLIIDSSSGARFEPDKNITRAEFAVFIAKGLGLAGDESSARRFADVSPGSQAAAYIGAAAKAGIINGTPNGTFMPASYITREQMALMMVRAMEYAGYDINLGGSSAQVLTRFKDGAKIQSKETVAKAVKEGIIQGVNTNTFQPAGKATRAQAAVMLKRVLNKLNYL